MANIPKHEVETIKRHNWLIGDEYGSSMTARDLRDGIYFAQKDMEAMGVDLDYDDAYKVTVGDNQIILTVEVEE